MKVTALVCLVCGDFDRNKTTFAIILYNNKDFILKIEHVYNNMCMLYI